MKLPTIPTLVPSGPPAEHLLAEVLIDPYLDADFVARYLPFVKKGTRVRLLTREKLATLLPAVNEVAKQDTIASEVRSARTSMIDTSSSTGSRAINPALHSKAVALSRRH
jgi:hypothetical protein